MCGATREGLIRHARIRETVKAVELSKETKEARLRWHRDVLSGGRIHNEKR